MPHCVIEYSNDIKPKPNISKLCEKLHQVFIDSGLFDPNAVKTRAKRYEDFIVATDDGKSGFVHITALILSGRPLDKRQNLSQNLFKSAKEMLPAVARLTVDIQEMNRDTFTK